MATFTILDFWLIAAVSIGGASLIALGFWLLTSRRSNGTFIVGDTAVPTFLFDGDDLRDATADAHNMIKGVPAQMSGKQAVVHILGNRFPLLATAIDDIAHGETRRLLSADSGPMWIELKDLNGLLRLTLNGSTSHDSMTISEIATQDAMVSELSFLRSVMDQSPQLIWQEDAQGKLSWANASYLHLSDSMESHDGVSQFAWPDTSVFPNLHLDANDSRPKVRRISVALNRQKAEAWYDVTTQRDGDGVLHFAADANAIVTAEQNKRKVVQTLSKIFAHLSVGLAIFDHNRQLTIFNPALMELTRMRPDFLSARPTVDMFLDQLREARMLPEPKNYSSWREQFTALEAAARQGTYTESWDLPDGQTFKVTGRPYPDNSFAFFFEDVSAEVSLTRRFRSDIETGQGVLDTLPDAIAVFSAAGTLVMTNKAYSDLWQVADSDFVQIHDIRTELMTWQMHCAASPIWSELRNFIGTSGERNLWSDQAVLDDGRQISCKAQPISGGMTMVTFSAATVMRPLIHKLTMVDPAIRAAKR